MIYFNNGNKIEKNDKEGRLQFNIYVCVSVCVRNIHVLVNVVQQMFNQKWCKTFSFVTE